MKKHYLSALIFILLGSAIIWYFSNYSDTDIAINIGKATAYSLLLLIVLMTLSILVIDASKVSIFLLIGIAWLLSTSYISFNLFEEVSDYSNVKNFINETSDSISAGSLINDSETEEDKYLSIMRNHVKKLQQTQNHLSDSVLKANISNSLNYENLINLETVKLNKEKISFLVDSIVVTEERVITIFQETTNALSKQTDSKSKTALVGFNNGKAKGLKDVNVIYSNQRDIYNSMEQILELRVLQDSDFVVKNGTLVINNEDTLNKYNSLSEKYNKLLQLQNELREKALNNFQEAKDKLL